MRSVKRIAVINYVGMGLVLISLILMLIDAKFETNIELFTPSILLLFVAAPLIFGAKLWRDKAEKKGRIQMVVSTILLVFSLAGSVLGMFFLFHK